jgi:hypothetical protein
VKMITSDNVRKFMRTFVFEISLGSNVDLGELQGAAESSASEPVWRKLVATFSCGC